MRYFQIDLTSALHYCVCGNLMSKEHFLHHRRTFDQNVLIMVLSGTLHISQSNVSFSISAGQYILLHAGEEHYGFKPSEGELSYLWVHFTAQSPIKSVDLAESSDIFCLPSETLNLSSQTLNLSSETLKLSSETLNAISDHAKRQFCILPDSGKIAITQRAILLFQQLIDFSRQSELLFPQMMDYTLNLLILELAQEQFNAYHNTSLQIPPSLLTMISWIRANCHQLIDVHSIASEFGYNPVYLSSLFKKYTNLTLIQFLNKTRIEVSKNLLANNMISIKEAAYSSGFSDEKYYMKTFKKYEGITPSQYKNAFHS